MIRELVLYVIVWWRTIQLEAANIMWGTKEEAACRKD
jgi:hypothetical protein